MFPHRKGGQAMEVVESPSPCGISCPGLCDKVVLGVQLGLMLIRGSVAAPVHGHSCGIIPQDSLSATFRKGVLKNSSHPVRENIIISTNLFPNSWDCRKCSVALGSDIDVQGTVFPPKVPCVCFFVCLTFQQWQIEQCFFFNI